MAGSAAAVATGCDVVLPSVAAFDAYTLGAFGQGTKMKFVANLLVTIHNLATAEALCSA